jgi:lysophospholipase L1-like esterase
VAEGAWRQGRDIADALADAFAAELEGTDPAHREKLETLNGIHSNAAGFRRWLETRADAGGPGNAPSSTAPHHHPRSSHA